MKHVLSIGTPIAMGTATVAASLAENMTGWTRFIIVLVGGVLTISISAAIYQARRYEVARARMAMCRECQSLGAQGFACGVPQRQRPANCPLKIK